MPLTRTGHGESRETSIFNWAHCHSIKMKSFTGENERELNNEQANCSEWPTRNIYFIDLTPLKKF